MKVWGGRFSKATDSAVEAYTSSLAIDSRLWKADIQGSIAHARMLGRVGVIEPAESTQIVQGLEKVAANIESGALTPDPHAEDIHSEIERWLLDEVAALAGKLHTGRSRNDQVVTATRLHLREELGGLQGEIRELQEWIVATAEQHLHTIMPGLTHMQHAQPVSLAHHLLAYFWMLVRDQERLGDSLKRINRLPLGSAALAGTSYPLDREGVARELGFDAVTENSLDAVSDRDFVVEFLSAGSLIMTHLSRLAEEIILWSTPEFGFIELDDSVTTGSSIMPQKKNPDVAELIRGRVGRLNGALMGMLTTLKALPLSYNRDLQEDKFHLFEGLDTVRASTRLMGTMLRSAKFRTERMRQALEGDFSNATDLADFLVKRNMPFRQAHEVVGRLVRESIETSVAFEEVVRKELGSKAAECLKPEAVLAARQTVGGTGPEAVTNQLRKAKALV